MKTLTSAFAVLILSAGWVSAQDMSDVASRSQPATSARSSAHDVTGFVAPSTPGPGISPQSMKTPPNPNVVLKPKLGGVFVDGVKYGTVMISPTAPASYGIGEKYLSAPSPSYDLQHESGPAAHREAGGMKLFSLEF
jgi:hypothetical protein